MLHRSSFIKATCCGLVAVFGSSACDATTDDSGIDGSESAEVEGSSTTTPVNLTPAYWNVDADPHSPSPGSEPLNVIITTKNTQLVDIADALGRSQTGLNPLLTWREVVSGTGFDFVTTGGTACISVEKATIDGAPGSATTGRDPQTLAYRLGGCAGVLSDGESHARAWESVDRRKCVRGVSKEECKHLEPTQYRALEETTWYLALSQEHVCKVDVNGEAKPWHCILPQHFQGKPLMSIKGPAKPYESIRGGYDQGRDDFVADLKKLDGKVFNDRRFNVSCEAIPRPEGKGLKVPISVEDAAANPSIRTEIDPDSGKTILERVAWDAAATHCTISADGT